MIHTIDDIHAEEIVDSRGTPTLHVVVSSGGFTGVFDVPSGASTGAHEAYELRDTGKHVTTAVANVNTKIRDALLGHDVVDQKGIDTILLTLDGTPNKKELGGNAIIGVSVACAKAAAQALGMELYVYLQGLATMAPSQKTPYIYMNIINGGKHATNGLAFQEYHIVPQVDTVAEAVAMGAHIQDVLRKNIIARYGEDSVVLGDEGGFAPAIQNVREPLVLIAEAIIEAGYSGKVRLALDVAASSFFEHGTYIVDGKNITPQELYALYESLIAEFDISSIEDPFDEEDFTSFTKLHQQYPNLFVVGDDLTVTNTERLRLAIEKKSINAMIIKPNQVGSLSETLAAMAMARAHDIHLIVSHRSGETDDTFIADLAYAFGCFALKSGAPRKPERKVKYDRLEMISQK